MSIFTAIYKNLTYDFSPKCPRCDAAARELKELKAGITAEAICALRHEVSALKKRIAELEEESELDKMLRRAHESVIASQTKELASFYGDATDGISCP